MHEGQRAALYSGWERRKEKEIEDLKKLYIPRKDRISAFVLGTVSDWIKCLLSRIGLSALRPLDTDWVLDFSYIFGHALQLDDNKGVFFG